MVSIIKTPIITNDKLPNELMNADMCSSIIKIGGEGIEVYDFNTLEKKKDIKTFYLFDMSASPCGTFAAGTNENPNIHIWDTKSGELVQVIKLSGFAPKHTFTPTNELLVSIENCIFSYNYCTETKQWVLNHTYTIPTTSGLIVKIEHNKEHLFACGTNTGHIHVFDTNSQKMTGTLEQFVSGDESEIYSLTFFKNMLAASSWNGINITIDISTGKHTVLENLTSIFSCKSVNIFNLLLTPSLTYVIASKNYKTYVWDVSTGKIVEVLDINILEEHSTFTPGGTKLVFTSRDSQIKVVDWKV